MPPSEEHWLVMRLAQNLHELTAHVRQLKALFEKAVAKAKKGGELEKLKELKERYRPVVDRLKLIKRVQLDAMALAQVSRPTLDYQH
jgi:hypothetical protein